MSLIFPDTTVLVSFARLGRIDLFADLVKSRGVWTVTIAQEVSRHASTPGLEGLHRVRDILGDPVMPTPAERVSGLTLRARIAKPGDGPFAHHGEAETIAVMRSRAPAGLLITDDLAAADLARSSDVNIRVFTTGDLLRLAVKGKLIDLDTLWEMIDILRTHKRARGMPLRRGHLSQWVYGSN